MLHLENFFEKSFALLLTTPIFEQKTSAILTECAKSSIIIISCIFTPKDA